MLVSARVESPTAGLAARRPAAQRFAAWLKADAQPTVWDDEEAYQLVNAGERIRQAPELIRQLEKLSIEHRQ